MKTLPLSNDIISRRINEMAIDLHNQITKHVKLNEFFAIQFDDSTDKSKLAQFLCFVECMLLCKPIPGSATD